MSNETKPQRPVREFWDKICSLKHYGFIHSPDNSRVLKAEGIGNWIDKHEAQEIVDEAQQLINQLRAERDALRDEVGQVKGEYDRAVNKVDALQQRLTAADEQLDVLRTLLAEPAESPACAKSQGEPAAQPQGDTEEVVELRKKLEEALAALRYMERGGCELRGKIDALRTRPQAEPVACSHEWTDDGEFLLACTACGAQEDHSPGWRDMASAPRDGTMLRLLVDFEDHSTEDVDQAPTIGANNFDNDDEDLWQFAGWCWSHDHFTEGKGVPVGWLPMLESITTSVAERPVPVVVVLPDREAMRDIIAQSIGGDTYDCTRVWSAWGVGTMSEDDFVPVVGQEDRLYEIADACLDEVARLNAKS